MRLYLQYKYFFSSKSTVDSSISHLSGFCLLRFCQWYLIFLLYSLDGSYRYTSLAFCTHVRFCIVILSILKALSDARYIAIVAKQNRQVTSSTATSVVARSLGKTISANTVRHRLCSTNCSIQIGMREIGPMSRSLVSPICPGIG